MQKILVIGGGEKQTALASILGKTHSVMHIEGEVPPSALEASDTVILPLPATADGCYINYSKTKIADIFNDEDRLYIGGKIGEAFLKYRASYNIIDYTECEEFKIRNAVPTAEAALALAIENTDFTISGSEILVCGYGCIGEYLSKILKSMGAAVTVAARRLQSRARAETNGHSAIKFNQISLGRFDIIFNTVPYPVLTDSILSRISPELIIDLASGVSGGTDFGAAGKYGIKALHALALPGKFSPESAAEITAETVINLL